MPELANPDREWVYFHEFNPFDPTAALGVGAEVPLYISSVDVFFDANDPEVPNRDYNGVVQLALSLSEGIEVAGGVIKPDAQPSYGGVVVAVDDEFAGSTACGIPFMKRCAWDGRPFRTLRGVRPPVGTPWRYAELEVIARGVSAGGNTYNAAQVSIPIGGFAERLRAAWATDVYAGTGGFEGGDDLKGKTKLRAIGDIAHAPAILVDPADEWWDVAPIDGFDSNVKVFQGGVEYSYSVSSPPAPGECYIDAANGRVQTNGMPVAPITVSFVSGFAGGATSMADTFEALLVDELGVDPAEIDGDTFDALNTANDEAISLCFLDATTYADVADKILGSGGSFHTEDAGKVQVFQFQPPDAVTEDDADLLITDDDIIRGQLKFRAEQIPPFRLDMDYARCWAPMNETDIRTAAAPSERTFLSQEWRTAPFENPTTYARHKLSQPKRFQSYFREKAAGEAEVARLGAMFTVRPEVIDVAIAAAPFGLKAHKQVWVRSAFYGVDAAFRAINVKNMSSSGRVELTLWRPNA